MKRRVFLRRVCELGALQVLLPLCPQQAIAQGRKKYFITSHMESPPNEDYKHAKAEDGPGFLCLFDVHEQKLRRFPVPLQVHSFNPHPLQPHLVLGVAKWTPSAIVADVRDGTVVKALKAPDSYRFFGHATFDRSGQHAFVTASSEKLNRGAICVYGAKTWTLEDILNPELLYPHECLMMPDNQLAVTGYNHSGPGALLFINPIRPGVARSFQTPRCSHILPLDAANIAVSGGGKDKPAELALVNLKSGVVRNVQKTPGYPARPLISEALSLAALSSSEIAVTLPSTQQVLIWNTETDRISELSLEGSTKGLMALDQTLNVTYGNGTLSIFRVLGSAADRKFEREPVNFEVGNGRHLKLMSL